MRLYPSTRRRGLKVQSVLTDNGKEFCGAEGSRPCRLDAGQLGERNRIRDKLGAGIRADDLHLLAHPSAISIISFLVELWWWTVPQQSEQMRKLDRDGTPSHYAAYRLVSQETLRTDLPALVSVGAELPRDSRMSLWAPVWRQRTHASSRRARAAATAAQRGRATRTNFRENSWPKMVVWMVNLIQAHPE